MKEELKRKIRELIRKHGGRLTFSQLVQALRELAEEYGANLDHMPEE